MYSFDENFKLEENGLLDQLLLKKDGKLFNFLLFLRFGMF